MQIQLSIFLYVYLAFLVLWFFFSITALYHVFKFGFRNFISYMSVFVYIFVSVAVLAATFVYISQADWTTKLLDIDTSQSIITDWE